MARRRRRKRGLAGNFKRTYKRLVRRLKWCLAVVFVVFLGVYVLKNVMPRNIGIRNTVTSKEYNGIDVSKYQGIIDWQKVAADEKIQFVYIKASEGATKIDNKYEHNIVKAREASLKVGSYHFFIGRKPAKAQFANFNRYVKRSKQDLIPMVDVEASGNSSISRHELQKNLMEFMELVKSKYGKYPLLYSQYGFYNKMLAPEFNKFYICIARYGKKEPLLNGGGKYNIWQYSEKGKVDGIEGPVDLDRFANGTKLTDIEL